MKIWSTVRRIRVVRVDVGDPPMRDRARVGRGRVRPMGGRWTIAGASLLAVTGVAALPALSAGATGPSGTGSSAGTVDIAPPPVYSLTVSPSKFTFAKCGGGSSTPTQLGFPYGYCSYGSEGATSVTGGITITNTGTAGHIDVNGSNAIPSDGGAPWTLESGNWSGPDEYALNTFGEGGGGASSLVLSTAPMCDTNFNLNTSPNGCSAASGAAQEEEVLLYGPQSSTDTSSKFTSTITWTAGP
jgi:hypothetical protein